MWRTLLDLPRRSLGFLSRGEDALASLSKQVASLSDQLRDSLKRTDGTRDELHKVRQELGELRREVHDRLLQNTMTVTRAARALEGGVTPAGNGRRTAGVAADRCRGRGSAGKRSTTKGANASSMSASETALKPVR